MHDIPYGSNFCRINSAMHRMQAKAFIFPTIGSPQDHLWLVGIFIKTQWVITKCRMMPLACGFLSAGGKASAVIVLVNQRFYVTRDAGADFQIEVRRLMKRVYFRTGSCKPCMYFIEKRS